MMLNIARAAFGLYYYVGKERFLTRAIDTLALVCSPFFVRVGASNRKGRSTPSTVEHLSPIEVSKAHPWRQYLLDRVLASG